MSPSFYSSFDTEKLDSLLMQVAKPAQYLGGEINVIKKDFNKAAVRVCLIFPDKYEMGMSHTGLKILYHILNQIPDVVCERAYAPELDMEALLRKEQLPLFSLESKKPLGAFDILGFSFTYELTYTNFLNILDLSGIPLRQKDRQLGHPLIVGGGGAMMNAEPVAPFLDCAALGDGEELVCDLVNAVRAWKQTGASRNQLLDQLTAIEGIYVPSFFEPIYQPDGTLKEVKALKPGYERVNKRVLSSIDQAPFPTQLLVPAVKLIHDRVGIEIQRGCNRACRFCQAGYIDRPVRQRSPETILKIAEESLKNTGLEELSLLSLSAADYDPLVPLLAKLNDCYADKKVSISVPATRTEKLTPDLIEQIKKVRKTGFTIAPEAGSPRMRRVINKGNLVDDLYRAVENAFKEGWDLLKLYYMVGLPFELDDDVLGIAGEGNEVIKICLRYSQRSQINLSVSSFVPKPHTPFQWEPQMTIEETRRKHHLVRSHLKNRRIHMKTHRPEMSYLEGLVSRGDRRVADLIERAFYKGCRFDEWEEHFRFDWWQEAITEWGADVAFYLHRRKGLHEILPWDHLFAQMDKTWLWGEYYKASQAAYEGVEQTDPMLSVMISSEKHGLKPLEGQLPGFTEDCSRQRCSYCGVCDFKETKNRIYVVDETPLVVKKGNREWYGWQPKKAPVVTTSSTETPLPKPLSLRFQYTKTGLARFMGHLELMGVLRRALRRLELPVKYSEGFHPQMKISMSHPLSLGVESACEFFDLDLFQFVDWGPLKERFQAVLPEGLTLVSVEPIDRQGPSLYSSLSQIDYEVFGRDVWPKDFKNLLEDYVGATQFLFNKKNREYDLKKWVQMDLHHLPQKIEVSIQVTPEGGVNLKEALAFILKKTPDDLGGLRIVKKNMRFGRQAQA